MVEKGVSGDMSRVHRHLGCFDTTCRMHHASLELPRVGQADVGTPFSLELRKPRERKAFL